MILAVIFLVVVAIVGLTILIAAHVGKRERRREEGKYEALVSEAKESYERVQRELRSSGFVSSERIGSFGYEELNRRYKGKIEDNVNVEIDQTGRKIACYILDPYELNVYGFDDLFNAELIINNGSVSTSATTRGTGVSVGMLHAGKAVTSGSSNQIIRAIIVLLAFKDGKQFPVNFLDHNTFTCFEGDEKYNEALLKAKSFMTKMQVILNDKPLS